MPSPSSLDALGDLLDRPGVFVFGSNDYFEPTMRNPLRYLLPDDGKRCDQQPRAALARPALRFGGRRLAGPDQHLRAR